MQEGVLRVVARVVVEVAEVAIAMYGNLYLLWGLLKQQQLVLEEAAVLRVDLLAWGLM